MVASVAWRNGVPRSDVEDVVADVFVKVYQKLGLFDPKHAFSTWLYRVAFNEVVDFGRRRKHERSRAEMPADLRADTVSSSVRLEEDERRRLLHEALAELDVRYREALHLVHVEGRKVDEAAGLLGVPSGTMKTRLMRGRRQLRELLERRHPEYFREVQSDE
jgi:RNA polymerase sigma-70 factor (ECF subfamily)